MVDDIELDDGELPDEDTDPDSPRNERVPPEDADEPPERAGGA
jgi:hypothetical protein